MAVVTSRWGPPAWQGWVPTSVTSPCRYCLSQQDCLCAQGCYWKDLAHLGRDLAKTVALDHTIQGVPTQVPTALALVGWRLCPLTPQEHHGCDSSL